MTATTQPTIAHGIARLHPQQGLSINRWTWGPEWSLPPNRTGRWVIDRIYNAAIRVEFDESIELDDRRELSAWYRLDAAREALSSEQEARRDEWLTWADKREAELFAREWTARKRREHGDLPTVAAGAYVRDGRSSGVWHIATGRTADDWGDPYMVRIGTECHAGLVVDLGDPDLRGLTTTAGPVRSVCKRCLPRATHAAGRPETEAVLA
jgi:hypothetical protein